MAFKLPKVRGQSRKSWSLGSIAKDPRRAYQVTLDHTPSTYPPKTALTSLVLLHLGIRYLIPSNILPCHVYNPLISWLHFISFHVFKETKRLSWLLGCGNTSCGGMRSTILSSAGIWRHIHPLLQKKKVFDFHWRAVCQIILPIYCQYLWGFKFLSREQPCFMAAASGVTQFQPLQTNENRSLCLQNEQGILSRFQSQILFLEIQGEKSTWNTFHCYHSLSVSRVAVIYRSRLLFNL